MDPIVLGVLGGVGFLILAAIGMPIGYAAAITGFVGTAAIVGVTPALSMLGTFPHSHVAKYVFAVVPLFILMGQLAFASGIGEDLFKMGRKWVGHLPGGLGSATILGGAGFAATCGSSVASVSVLSQVALPEMEKHGYHNRVSAGVVAGASTLSALIPPSAIIVVYAIMTEQSIGKMLVAGYLPGLLTVALYLTAMALWAYRWPEYAPRAERSSWAERFTSMKSLWPVIGIVVIVMGGIYAGFFTPTQAGGVGALAVFVIGLARRQLTVTKVRAAFLATASTTSMVFLIVVGFFMVTTFLELTGLPSAIASWLIDLSAPRLMILVGILLLYLVLGMFVESLGMLMLTLPVVVPAIIALGYDPIWFGIVVIVMVELALETPPVGLNLFVMKGGAPHIPMTDIWWGVVPFIVADVFVVVLLVAFPDIVLLLPNTMG